GNVPTTRDVESGLAYTSVSRSTRADTCPEEHDCASDRWAAAELPGDEEDEVLAHASADARANTPIDLMVIPPNRGGRRRTTAVLTKACCFYFVACGRMPCHRAERRFAPRTSGGPDASLGCHGGEHENRNPAGPRRRAAAAYRAR